MRWLVVVGIALTMAMGCGGSGGARAARPREAEYLGKIVLVGNHSIPRDALVPGLALERVRAAGRSLDPYQLTVDTQRIRTEYLKRGFFEIDVQARVDHEGTAQVVVFTIIEGTRATLQVVLRGLPPEVSEAEARALIRLPDGAPFSYAVFDEAKVPLINLVENAGYPHVAIDAAVLADKVRGVATARFEIAAGGRAVFGPVAIAGTAGQLAGAITGRLAFRPGDVYSAKALAESQRAIYELGRFSTVRVDVDRKAGAVVPVTIAVSEAGRHEVRASVGGGLETDAIQMRTRAGGSLIPLSHPLWTLAADLRPAATIRREDTDFQAKLRALATATRVDMFRPRLRGELEVGVDYITIDAFTSAGPRFRAGFSTPIGLPWLSLRAGWVIEYLAIQGVKIDEPVRTEIGLDHDQRRGAYELTLTAEGRDNPIDARKGLFASVHASAGTPYALGASRYLQLTPDLRAYYPIGPLVVAARARVGLIYGEVPVTERYYSGGASSHRGFSDRLLSPTAAGIDGDGDPGQVAIGGAALIETGVELRIPLGDLKGVPYGSTVFLDGGDVTRTPGELDAAHLHWAAGVGIYGKLFGLKFRGDLGYRLNRTGPGEPEAGSGVWANLSPHIGVGDAY